MDFTLFSSVASLSNIIMHKKVAYPTLVLAPI